LFVFVSPMIEEKKLKKIAKDHVRIFKSARPVSDATKFARENKYFNLRPSINKFGSEGYQTIAFELAESQGFIEDLFLPVSSGVALKGIAEGFKKLGFLPRFHLCQPAAVCSLASAFDRDFVPEKKNLAKSIVARYTPLRKEIIELVQKSLGSGWVIRSQEILEAEKILTKSSIATSYEGALALAAVFKARKKGFKLGKTVCLLTGTRY
ncbi:MAG: pyridoxal-phosphate dependent enzyme, partial [Minisyncoccales bacterium]